MLKAFLSQRKAFFEFPNISSFSLSIRSLAKSFQVRHSLLIRRVALPPASGDTVLVRCLRKRSVTVQDTRSPRHYFAAAAIVHRKVLSFVTLRIEICCFLQRSKFENGLLIKFNIYWKIILWGVKDHPALHLDVCGLNSCAKKEQKVSLFYILLFKWICTSLSCRILSWSRKEVNGGSWNFTS